MKKLNFLFACGMMLAASISFSACSSDDDGGSGNPNADNSVIVNNKGEKLFVTKVGRHILSYNGVGLLTHVNTEYEGYTIDWENMSITWNDGEKYNFSLNGAGYISGFSISTEDGSESFSFEYDGEGHLLGFTKRGVEEVVSTRNTYSNGMLVKIEKYEKFHEDGEDCETRDIYTFSYDNQSLVNSLLQCTMSTNTAFPDCWGHYDIESVLWLAGLFGKPSSMLPTKVVDARETTYRNGMSSTTTCNFSYTFNTDGTLRTERITGDYKNRAYSYSIAPSAPSYEALAMPFTP